MDHADTAINTQPTVADKTESEESPEQDEKDGDGGWLSGWGVAGITTVVQKTADVVNKMQDKVRQLLLFSIIVMATWGQLVPLSVHNFVKCNIL